MTRLLLGCVLFACASAMAQTSGGSTSQSATDLDLSVPQQAPIDYRSNPTYAADAPGVYYGDTSGRSRSTMSSEVREQQRIAAQAEQCQGELHGAVTAGFGHASRGGNSNWQGVNLNSCKTTYGDDGKPRTMGISINVGRGEGPGYFGPGYYGPGPGWYAPHPGW